MLACSLRAASAGAARSAALPRTPSVSSGSMAVARRVLSSSAKNRPLSPHLTIYKFPFNAVTSVGFRATGILLTTGVAGVSIGMIGASKPLEYYVNCLKGSPFLLFLAKLSVAAPLTYHYIGGIRHLTWDNVIGHNPDMVRKTGLFLVGATALISLAAAVTECDE